MKRTTSLHNPLFEARWRAVVKRVSSAGPYVRGLVWFLCGIGGLWHGTTTDEAVTYRVFEVIEEGGKVSRTEPVAARVLPRWAADVSQGGWGWRPREANEPFFAVPLPFVIPPPEGSGEPFYPHNHCPSITWLPNGDLLAIWFNTPSHFVLVRDRGNSSVGSSVFSNNPGPPWHGVLYNAVYADGHTQGVAINELRVQTRSQTLDPGGAGGYF